MDEPLNDEGQQPIPMTPELEQVSKILSAQLFELHVVWQQYRQLYAEPTTIDLLNRTAGTFFKIVQDQLWDSVLLGICRLVDPPKSMGRPNLTLQSLPPLITDENLRGEVQTACDLAVVVAEFAKTHRNKRIAHQDHGYATNPTLLNDSVISRQRVEEMLAALRAVLQLIERHYNDRDVLYGNTIGIVSGANRLTAALRRGERYAKRILEGGES